MSINNKAKKREYRFLTQEGKKTALRSIRVPIDFPIDSLDLKNIVSELDLIAANGKGNVSQESLEKVLEYYKQIAAENDDS